MLLVLRRQRGVIVLDALLLSSLLLVLLWGHMFVRRRRNLETNRLDGIKIWISVLFFFRQIIFIYGYIV